MTQREQEILAILKTEPTISQQELADRLKITRSSVAVHITNLIKKGYILGKGYVISEDPYIVVIGGANVDIQGYPHQPLLPHDSNIGTVKVSLGGVGRNIAENCARLNIPTRLISVVGNDLYGQEILKHAQAIGLNMQDTLVLSDTNTSTYLSILDQNRELAVAINHMDSIERLTIDTIKAKRSLLEHAQLVVLDTNLSQAVLDYLLTTFTKTTFFVDTVSSSKAIKIKNHLDKIHTLKPNALETVTLGKSTKSNPTLIEVGYSLGCQRAFISQGKDGVLVIDGQHHHHYPANQVDVVNTTGAGDAFMAGLVYAYIKGYDEPTTVQVAMAAATLALTHQDTINPDFNEKTVLTKTKEIFHD